jgi:hypothetical protein
MRVLLRYRAALWVAGLIALLVCGQPSLAEPPVPKPMLVLREGLNGAINEWSGPAKFVLYGDGTVITETSNETSENGGEPRYYRTRLTPAQTSHLIQSLNVKKTIGTSRRQYGQGQGVTWQLIYWGASTRTEITILGSLDQAPKKVMKLVRSLETYPNRGSRYLGYDYLLSFGNAPEQPSLPWPAEWHFLKFSEAMLAGQRVPEGRYEYRLDAIHALELVKKLAEAHTQCISVNGHVWKVRFYPVPRLPNDLLWVHHPL